MSQDIAGQIFTGVGAGVSAGGTLIGARTQATSLRSEAAQYDAQALLDQATGQRKAMEDVRQGQIQQSRVLALVSASGAGASDPSVVTALANMAGEADYAKQVSLYEGDTAAQSDHAQAAARRSEATNAMTAGKFAAASTLLKAGSTLYDRYGKS